MPVVDSGSGVVGDRLLEVGELAGPLAAGDRAVGDQRDARRSRSRGTRAAAAPRSTTSWACFGPTYPTIPHMAASLGDVRWPAAARMPRHVCRTGGLPHGPDDAGREPSPYVELDRAAWAALALDDREPAHPDEIERLRGLGDALDLDEVQQVYLPLSRLLSLYVEARRAAAPAAGGVPRPAAAAAHAVRDRARRLGGGRQVHDRPRAAADARALARAPQRRAGHHRRLPATPTPSSSAAGSCTARASRSPTTAGRCCGSWSTSSRARTRSRRRSTPTSSTTSCPTRRSSSSAPTS